MSAGVIGAIVASLLSTFVLQPMLIGRWDKRMVAVDKILFMEGGATLAELASILNIGWFAMGTLAQALEKRVEKGELDKVRPPKGHPWVRVVRDTRYSLVETSKP